MKTVAKYNTLKGISMLLTFGTPIGTLLGCSSLFVQRSESALSAAAIFVILIVLALAKDKILEKWKTPSALIISLVVLILLVLVENVIKPLKIVAIATMITCGLDEIVFKPLYKRTEILLPKEADAFKHVGFIFTKTATLEQLAKRNEAK